MGEYLCGEACNPYVNGLSYSDWGKIFVSWTNRMCVEHEEPANETRKQQVDQNEMENNMDLGFAMSDDGIKWLPGKEPVFTEHSIEEKLRRAREGLPREEERILADLGRDREKGIDCRSTEAIVKRMESNSGLLNQDGQWRECKMTSTC